MDCILQLYGIQQKDKKFKVVCERCADKGFVDDKCSKCNGQGSHYKTIKMWELNKFPVEVEKIDRASKDSFYNGVQTSYKGELRYWTSSDEFYNERDKLVHFSKEDALKECDRRNEPIKKLLQENTSSHKRTSYIQYPFHVGDVVIDMDDRIGFIASICDCTSCLQRGFNEPYVVYFDGDNDYITNYQAQNISKYFKRIGSHCFNNK